MTDKEQVNEIVRRFFSIFTNTNKQEPNWNLLYELCIPGTIIIKKSGLSQEIYNVDTFIEPRKKMLSDGMLTEFEESETGEETKITGNIAQRFSLYQKSGYLNGKQFKEYGTKIFQFIKTKDGWKINAVVWQDDES